MPTPTRSPEHHALRAECRHTAAALADVRRLTWYETGHDGDSRPGRMDAAELPPAADTTAYLCGPLPFMPGVRAGLLDRGLPAGRVHYEVFGPGLLDRE